MKKHILISLLVSICFIKNVCGQEDFKFIQNDTISSQKAIITIFARGNIPTCALINAAPAFTANGKFVYLGQSSSVENISIMSSNLINGHWSVPKTAPFSGQYRNLEPAFASDRKYMIFASSRPKVPNGRLTDTIMNSYFLEQAVISGGLHCERKAGVNPKYSRPSLI